LENNVLDILILADIDDLTWKFGTGSADLIVSCGDISDQVILEASSAFNCRRILAVKGNHDPPGPFPEPIKDLHLRTETHMGITFGGLNGSWKYKPRGNFLYDQLEAEVALSRLPRVDILVSHNSPRKIHDRNDGIHYGFEALNNYINEKNPSYLFHGHQHVNIRSLVNKTHVVGIYGFKLIST
jgi:Icc-related predicted phosphoesterase